MTIDHGSLVPAAEFNVREFARTAVGSHRPGMDLAGLAADPLPRELAELIDYLAHLERSTLTYLRGVLVTPTHKDARVTAFLVTWAYEKYWIADALDAVLEAQGYASRIETRSRSLLSRAWREAKERVEPIRESVIANAIGEDVIVSHTMTATIDEWLMRVAYSTLDELAGREELHKVIRDILDVKERHEQFFSAQSRDRLARSPKAVSVARRRLGRIQWPLGSADLPPAPAARFYRRLVGERAVDRIDTRIAGFPGLAGLHLVRRSAVSCLRAGGAR